MCNMSVVVNDKHDTLNLFMTWDIFMCVGQACFVQVTLGQMTTVVIFICIPRAHHKYAHQKKNAFLL